MAIRIERFPAGAEAAAARFNARLRAAGETSFDIAESPASKRYPEGEGRSVWQQFFLALENGGSTQEEVRGSYILQYQPYLAAGDTAPHAFLKLPVSEGIIDKKYALVGVMVVRDAMQRERSLYSVGMGGMTRPLPKLLAKLGWFVRAVPFYFRVLRPFRFFRNARILRSNRLRTIGCDLLAFSGIGWIGVRIMQLRGAGRGLASDCRITVEDSFGPWADELWKRAGGDYLFCGERSAAVLNTLYPLDDPRWIRLRVTRHDKTIGWALLLCTDLQGHKQFGNMRLGSIADCFAAPADAPAVIAAAVAHLKSLNPDLLVSNQLHSAWGDALLAHGFMKGPSNYVFASAPALTAKLGSLDERWTEIHINRGDGDGPINL